MNNVEPDYCRRRVLALATSLVCLFLGGQGALARSAAQSIVANIGAEVVRLANSAGAKATMRRRFASLVNRYANVPAVALLALGPYQRQLPANRREQFFRMVADYIAAFFVSYADEFRGSGFQVTSSFEDGRSTIVNSRIVAKGGEGAEVVWRISGGRVSDLKARGIWLSLQLRKRFTDILRRSGGDFGPLFEELESSQSW